MRPGLCRDGIGRHERSFSRCPARSGWPPDWCPQCHVGCCSAEGQPVFFHDPLLPSWVLGRAVSHPVTVVLKETCIAVGPGMGEGTHQRNRHLPTARCAPFTTSGKASDPGALPRNSGSLGRGREVFRNTFQLFSCSCELLSPTVKGSWSLPLSTGKKPGPRRALCPLASCCPHRHSAGEVTGDSSSPAPPAPECLHSPARTGCLCPAGRQVSSC